MNTNLMVIDLLFYYLYRPAKKSSVEKYKKYQFQFLRLAE